MIRLLSLCLAASIGPAVPAIAQSFGTLDVKPGRTLFVVDPSGRETQGRLVTLSPSSLTLDVKGRARTFTPADVALIERRGDSLRNGVIAGLAIGGICVFTCAIELRGGALAQAIAVNALIPVAIDALHRGRTRVWPARTRP
jgi:hypothetical protein